MRAGGVQTDERPDARRRGGKRRRWRAIGKFVNDSESEDARRGARSRTGPAVGRSKTTPQQHNRIVAARVARAPSNGRPERTQVPRRLTRPAASVSIARCAVVHGSPRSPARRLVVVSVSRSPFVAAREREWAHTPFAAIIADAKLPSTPPLPARSSRRRDPSRSAKKQLLSALRGRRAE